jgi:hypothetical protein
MKVSAIVVAGLLSFPFTNASAQSVNDAQIASIVVTTQSTSMQESSRSTVDQQGRQGLCRVDDH